jgi:uncharacterized protein
MFIDTSGLFCLHHRQERFHQEATDALKNTTMRLMHGYVLAEFVALANTRQLPREPVLEMISELVANPDFEVIWVDEALHEKGMELLRARLDKTYSLCDAISFVLMREEGIQDALTTDRHFEQKGFRRLLV